MPRRTVRAVGAPVVELFEARKPREMAVISKIDGIVSGIVKEQRKVIIVPDGRARSRASMRCRVPSMIARLT